MTKGTKITLWSIGGLAVATGLFFGIRAIIRATKSNGGGIVPPPLPPNPTPTPTPNNTVTEPPVKKEPKVRGGSFPIRFGDRGDHVKEWQKAINKWGDDWCSWSACNGGSWRSKIVEDGVFGEQTALYTNCHYPSTDCALCPLVGKGSLYPIGSADYSQCKVTWDKFKSVVGSSKANKYKNFSGAGYSNANGGGRVNTNYNGNCCEWCDDLSMGRAVGNVPPEGCADWMCGNPDWCPNTRPLVSGRPSGSSGLAPGFTGTPAPSNIKGFSGELSDDDYLNMLKGFRG